MEFRSLLGMDTDSVGFLKFMFSHQRPCVYLLFFRKRVVYVGQSKNLCGRVSSHLREKNFNAVYFLPCRKTDKPLVIEAFFIDVFQPKYNSHKRSSLLNEKIIKTLTRRFFRKFCLRCKKFMNRSDKFFFCGEGNVQHRNCKKPGSY